MVEPGEYVERRPPEIPADWRTRQQTQADLALRSPTALTKLIDQFKPTTEDFQIRGRTGYLSPRLIERMRFALAEVEDIRNLPGYMSGTAALEVIGCSFAKFSRLVQENPPSVLKREVVKARNHNSQVNPVYSSQYIDSLRLLYTPPAPRRTGQGISRASADVDRPSQALVGKVLERIDATSQPNLVDPTRVERDQLLRQVQQAVNWLERHLQPHRLEIVQLLHQLYDASAQLRGNQPMPMGVDRLLAHVERLRPRDDD